MRAIPFWYGNCGSPRWMQWAFSPPPATTTTTDDDTRRHRYSHRALLYTERMIGTLDLDANKRAAAKLIIWYARLSPHRPPYCEILDAVVNKTNDASAILSLLAMLPNNMDMREHHIGVTTALKALLRSCRLHHSKSLASNLPDLTYRGISYLWLVPAVETFYIEMLPCISNLQQSSPLNKYQSPHHHPFDFTIASLVVLLERISSDMTLNFKNFFYSIISSGLLEHTFTTLYEYGFRVHPCLSVIFSMFVDRYTLSKICGKYAHLVTENTACRDAAAIWYMMQMRGIRLIHDDDPRFAWSEATILQMQNLLRPQPALLRDIHCTDDEAASLMRSIQYNGLADTLKTAFRKGTNLSNVRTIVHEYFYAFVWTFVSRHSTWGRIVPGQSSSSSSSSSSLSSSSSTSP